MQKIETEMSEFRVTSEATNKVVKELTQQKQHEEEKTAKLEQTIAELEKAQEENNKKIASLTAQHQELVEHSEKLTSRRMSELKAEPLKRVTSEEVINLKVAFFRVLLLLLLFSIPSSH